MSGVTHTRDRNHLRLTYAGFDGVEFDLLDETGKRLRAVRVDVGTGQSWRRAVRFPDMGSDATASTGNDRLDQAILDRASEELVRLEAAAAALRAAA